MSTLGVFVAKQDEDEDIPVVGYSNKDFDQQVKKVIDKKYSNDVASSKDPELSRFVMRMAKDRRKSEDANYNDSGSGMFSRIREEKRVKEGIERLHYPSKRSSIKNSSKRGR